MNWHNLANLSFGASLEKELLDELNEEEQDGELAEDEEDQKQHFDYFCVLDFEACRQQVGDNQYIYEITEFPVVLLNAKTLKVWVTTIDPL